MTPQNRGPPGSQHAGQAGGPLGYPSNIPPTKAPRFTRATGVAFSALTMISLRVPTQWYLSSPN